MSIGLVRGLLTLATFAAFIALWIWAWSKQRKADFDEAATLPLEGAENPSAQGDRS
jgi:cytochrome c oxidase cbb3-type subunit 4